MKMYPISELLYASSRLDQSLVMCRGRLVEVLCIVDGSEQSYRQQCNEYNLNPEDFDRYGEPIVICKDWSNKGEYCVVFYKDLDITPVKLGYINQEGRVFYVMRTPLRNDWRQGFRFSSLRYAANRPNKNTLYQDLSDTIRNIFPSYYECLSKLYEKVNVSAMAWHRDWAMSKNSLYNKGREVGYVYQGRAVLDIKFNYLKESLNEAC